MSDFTNQSAGHGLLGPVQTLNGPTADPSQFTPKPNPPTPAPDSLVGDVQTATVNDHGIHIPDWLKYGAKGAKVGVLGTEIGRAVPAAAQAAGGLTNNVSLTNLWAVLKAGKHAAHHAKLGGAISGVGTILGGLGAAMNVTAAGKILADPKRRKGVGAAGDVADHLVGAGAGVASMVGGPLSWMLSAGYGVGKIADKLSGAKKGEMTGISGALGTMLHNRYKKLRPPMAPTDPAQLDDNNRTAEIARLKGYLAKSQDPGARSRLQKAIAKLQASQGDK